MNLNFNRVPLSEIAAGDTVRGPLTVSKVRYVRPSRIRPGDFVIILVNGQMIRVAADETVNKGVVRP